MTLCQFNDQPAKECIHRDDQGNCTGSCARLGSLQGKPWTYMRMSGKSDFDMKITRLPWNPRTGTEYRVDITVDHWDRKESASITLTPEGLMSLKKWIEAEMEIAIERQG